MIVTFSNCCPIIVVRISSRGLVNSHLFYDSKLSRWKLQSLRYNDTSFILDDPSPHALPFGRKIWRLDSSLNLVDPSCEDGEVILTFSSCSEDQFTCSNGQCIDIE